MLSNSRSSQGREIKGWVNNSGYRQVRCYLKGRSKTCDPLVHRLVAHKFIPNSDNLGLINHKDGDKLNNSVDNLEWCDHSHNLRHAYAAGLTCKKGVNHPLARLTEEDVLDIRRKRQNGEAVKAIAAQYRIHPTSVYKICLKKKWKHL